MSQLLLFDPSHRTVSEPRPALVKRGFQSVSDWKTPETEARDLRAARMEYYRRLRR